LHTASGGTRRNLKEVITMKKLLYLLLGVAWFTSLPLLADTLTEQGKPTDGTATTSTTQGSDGDC
jgi:hypothetical protein